MGATCFRTASQVEQNLLSPDFSAIRHKIQPHSPHLECASVRRLPWIDTPAIITYVLWVLRQYLPTFPFASLNTGSLHPGVAQIPDIVDADKDRQRGLCAEGVWENWAGRPISRYLTGRGVMKVVAGPPEKFSMSYG